MSIIHTVMISRFSVRSHATMVACWIALAALPAGRADDFTWNGGNGTWPSAGWTNVTTSASPVAGPTGASNTNTATISAGTVTFAGGIGGTGGLTKQGTGSLTPTGANTFTGATTVSAGTLALSGGNNRLGTSSAITLSGGTLDLGGNSQTTSGAVAFSGTSGLTSGTLTATTGNSFSPRGTLTLGANTAFVANLAGQRLIMQGISLTLTGSAGSSLNYGGNTASAANYIGVDAPGLASVTVNGPTLNFVIAAGQDNASGGWLRIGSNSGATGVVNLQSGTVNVGHSASLAARYNNDGVATASSGTLTITGGAFNVGTGTLTTTSGGANGYLYLINDNAGSTGNAIVNLNGGLLSAKRIVPGTGGGTKQVNFNGGTLTAAASDASFMNAADGFTVNVGDAGGTIDTGTFAITVGAPLLASGTGGLSKLGTGSLTLSAANSFTGNTTISAGTLALGAAGTFAASPVVSLAPGARLDLTSKTSGFSFGASQTLAGSGLVSLGAGRDLTISGSLAPGQSPGTLSLDGNLVLDATSTSVFEIDGVTSGLYDVVQESGGSRTATFGGTLSLAFAAGWSTETTLKLFDFATYSGAFSQVQTTGLGAGYSASFNELTGNVVVVPEPGLAALAAGISLAARRRR